MRNTTKLTLFIITAFSTTVYALPTGSLLLQGQVPEEVSLQVFAETAATGLDLTASPTALKVASVNEKSNSNTGYKIDLRSNNGGLLKNGSLDSLAYQISYDGGSLVSPTTTDQEVKTVISAGVYDVSSDVDISYTGKPATDMVEGTYSDTLVFTISAN